MEEDSQVNEEYSRMTLDELKVELENAKRKFRENMCIATGARLQEIRNAIYNLVECLKVSDIQTKERT